MNLRSIFPRLAALVFLAAALPAAAAEPSPHAIDIPRWFTETFLDFREDVRDAAKEGKRVMLYVGQDGCPYCKALMTVNFAQPDIQRTTRRHFVAVALNLWGDRETVWIDGRKRPEKELARHLGVQHTPTLLFLDEQGGVALRLNGYLPPERFRVALDYAAQRLEKRQSFTEYMAAHAPPSAAGLPAAPSFEGSRDLPKLLSAGKPLLVLFEQKGCAECTELHRDGLRHPEVAPLLGRFTVVRLDIGGAREVTVPGGRRMTEADWAKALRVTYTPSLVFFAPDAREAFRLEGYVRAFHLGSGLEYVASGAYRREPSFQRFIQARADSRRAKGESVDLW